MDVSKIPPGRNPPDEINAVIEIPQGGVPVKYELDKVSGALSSTGFRTPRMYYPSAAAAGYGPACRDASDVSGAIFPFRLSA